MRSFFELFRSSFSELRSVRTMTTLAMLMALQLVLSLYASIPLSDSLRLSLSFIASAAIGMLYGPFCAALSSGIVDVLQAFIKPTGPFFPGFTLTAILGGLIYGCLFYKNKATLPRIIIAKSLVNIFCNILLNSLWLYMLYGYGFWGLLPSRALKNLILLPFEVVILWVLLPSVVKIMGSIKKHT